MVPTWNNNKPVKHNHLAMKTTNQWVSFFRMHEVTTWELVNYPNLSSCLKYNIDVRRQLTKQLVNFGNRNVKCNLFISENKNKYIKGLAQDHTLIKAVKVKICGQKPSRIIKERIAQADLKLLRMLQHSIIMLYVPILAGKLHNLIPLKTSIAL